MPGRHKKADHSRSKKRTVALPVMLVLGIAAASAVVLRGPVAGPEGSGTPAAADVAGLRTEPRPAPAPDLALTEPTVAPPTPATVRPKPRPAPPKPKPIRKAEQKPSRGEERTPTGRCPVADKSTDHPNGQVPESHLCALPQDKHKLHGDAANAFWRLNAAYERKFGEDMCVSSSYRTLQEQIDLNRAKPSLTAKPGTSNHGWGRAVDLCDGVDKFGTPEYEWMRANAGEYGFENPSWARPGGSKPEAWHWEYTG